MGRRSFLRGDPAEKADRDVLEVVTELDRTANELPVGLRLTVQFFKFIRRFLRSQPGSLPLDLDLTFSGLR
jgi:hypothetical protein